MLPDDELNEVYLRLHIKQLPNLDRLSELHYLYYVIGFYYFQNQDAENKNDVFEKIYKDSTEVINHFFYELADMKMLLFDLVTGVRGIGGVKTTFNVKELPSYKKEMDEKNKIKTSGIENETEEERLERHRRFFEELKESFKQ